MFDMQKLAYFLEGNVFTGSHTNGQAVLRYKVELDRENEELSVWCWQQDRCFERAADKHHQPFPATQEGLDAVQDWLRGYWPDQAEK